MKSKIGFLDILFVLFIILKLIGVITWAWPVVLIPLWAIICIGVGAVTERNKKP